LLLCKNNKNQKRPSGSFHSKGLLESRSYKSPTSPTSPPQGYGWYRCRILGETETKIIVIYITRKKFILELQNFMLEDLKNRSD